MKNLFKKALNEIDVRQMMENTGKLTQLELGQTFENYRQAAEFTAGLIKKAGINDCEIVNFPADGKTVYQDKRMPLAWNATKGRLTIKKSCVPFENPVVADFQKHPFHLVKGSVSTPEAGVRVRIITETQLFAGEDAENCLVMANPTTPPRPKILKAALDLGAMGLITDYIVGRYETPDGIQWVNACTDGIKNHWHVQSEDRPFICFSVSPRTGDQIREAASAGSLFALVECDGKRSAGMLPAVTALIPGKKKMEFWMLAHLYEPLADDNSAGIVASIEIARVIKKLVQKGILPPLEFSLRLVFAMEMYGFAAFAERMGGDLRGKVVGAINNDGMPIIKNTGIKIHLAPPGTPFFGNYLMEKMADAYSTEADPAIERVIEEGMYADDTFLGDPTVGLPTLWLIASGKSMWHNSTQKINIVNPVYFARSAAFVAAWTASVLTLNRKNMPGAIAEALCCAKKHLRKEAEGITDALTSGGASGQSGYIAQEARERMLYRLKMEKGKMADFLKVAQSSRVKDALKTLASETRKLIAALKTKIKDHAPSAQGTRRDNWFNYAASIVPARASRGFPCDLISAPKAERICLPDGIIYGPLARILANMDGKKNLQRLIKEAEWEAKLELKPQDIKKYVAAVSYLSDYGYLETKFNSTIGKADIIAVLRKIGINDGDLLLAHCGLSAFGRIEGGAETVIDAIMQTIGKNGTVLFPTFTNSYIYFEGSAIKGTAYRPYDASNPDLIWTGKIPQTFLKRKDVHRSAHPTHSVAACGPLALKCVAQHKENDPPACKSSPFGKLLEHKGKILYFGTGLAPSTFLHFIEDEMNLPYLGNAVCRIKEANGKTRTVMIPKHLPGHRDFYSARAEDSKFFRKAFAGGLEIKETPLGFGKLQLIDAALFYDAGIKIVREDPDIFLCDSAECHFCSKHRRPQEKFARK